MTDLFERARTISALDVAQAAGLDLERRGTRWWACCPIHGEDTASFMVDESGRWHCFGCNQGGDGIALYAAIHGLSQGQAARELVDAHAPARPAGPSAQSVLRDVNRWKADELRRLYGLLAACRTRMEMIMQPVGPDAAFPPEFAKAARAQIMLLELINGIESASVTELFHASRGCA